MPEVHERPTGSAHVKPYQPYPFHWIPAAGARHASRDAYPMGVRGFPDGTAVKTLGGGEFPADTSEHAWLWETCKDCNVAAHDLAGLPPLAGTR